MEHFERDAAELEAWLSSATSRLHILAELDEPELQSLGAIKRKMELFLDFRKDVESHMALRSRVMALGGQLLRCRPRDVSIERRLATIEDGWLELLERLPNNEEQLHAAQMELLPSRQALAELLLWLDSLQPMLHDQHDPTALVDVGLMLHKYTGLKVDLANKQLTVDFVNQSAAANDTMTAAAALESTQFSEKLGELNSRYGHVLSQVNETLKQLQELQRNWQEHDTSVKALQMWLTDQEARLSRFRRLGHELSVRNALNECQAMQEQLLDKERDLSELKVMGKFISERSTCSESVGQVLTRELNDADERKARLEQQLSQVKQTLQSALEQWERYHHVLDAVSRVVTHTEYSMHRHRHASCDLASFRNTIQHVQVSLSLVDICSPMCIRKQMSGLDKSST